MIYRAAFAILVVRISWKLGQDFKIEVCCNGQERNLNYVLSFTGINAGHYTAYAKHPVSKQWHYFNDEATNIQSPQDDDYSNAYVLFYQRQGRYHSVLLNKKTDLCAA